MRLTPAEIADWASAYIEAVASPQLHDSPDSPLWWAIERFMVGTLDAAAHPEDCWLGILEVLARKPPEAVLGVLAAGPLEDLIGAQGPAFVDRIEVHARRDPAFRELLGGVWQSGPPEIWRRIESAQAHGPA